MGEVAEAVAAVEDPVARAALEHLAELVAAEAPDAEEGTSYGMPAWRLAGKPLLGFNLATAHVGLFPFSPDVVTAVRDRLDGYGVSKGGIRFDPAQPVPDDVVVEMLRLRRREITGA